MFQSRIFGVSGKIQRGETKVSHNILLVLFFSRKGSVISSTAVLIFTTGVVSTVVVLAVVVAALGVGIEGQLARQQVRYLAVCVARDTRVELNARLGQGSAGAATAAAA